MFRTPISITKGPVDIIHNHSIFSIGSCFSVNMGEKLAERKFRVLNNPFGTIFNPASIYQLLGHSIENKPLQPDLIVQNQDVYYHYQVHGDLSALNREDLADNLAETISNAHNQLKNADILIITFGSAITYRHKEHNIIVANCHKIPQKEFIREFMSVEAIVEGFSEMLGHIKEHNKHLKVILTVSPVRHLKESHADNMLSKSLLRVACDKITALHQDVDYFPAFEIMMDDLRDYRFYAEDMLHPSGTAIDYVWKQFTNRYFNEKTEKIVEDWEKVLTAIRHRPFHPTSLPHQKFLHSTINQLKKFEGIFDVSEEQSYLESQIV